MTQLIVETTKTFKTSDGFKFNNEREATQHQEVVDIASKANSLFKGDTSVGFALKEAGYHGIIPKNLFKVKKGDYFSGECKITNIGLNWVSKHAPEERWQKNRTVEIWYEQPDPDVPYCPGAMDDFSCSPSELSKRINGN